MTAMFRGFAARLDNKHDLHERLVKKSRDVTVESKRIIFMLHRVTRWAATARRAAAVTGCEAVVFECCPS